MTLTVERPPATQDAPQVTQDAPQVTQDAPQVTQDAPGAVEPWLLHVEVNPDAPFVAGHLSAVEMGKAATILAYLRERGVLVTASKEEILLVISREIAPALVERVAANAALLRAYVACPEGGRHHSLCPPYGRCWPCGEEAQQAERGPCAFVSHGADTGQEDAHAL